MKKDELRVARGQIIEKFVAIEQMIAAIVCWHYLGREDVDFMLNIFGNDQATFSFKRNVLLHLYKLQDSKFSDNLFRLNKIRNLFIHAPRIIEGPDSDEFYFRDSSGTEPVNIGKNPQEQLEKFNELFEAVYQQLEKMLADVGFPASTLIDYKDRRFI